MFGNKEKVLGIIQPVFENAFNRANELNHLVESRNQMPMEMLQFISSEVERIKHDLNSFVQLWKYGNKPTSNAFDDLSKLSNVISDIERKLSWQKDRYDRGTVQAYFYPELVKDAQKAQRIEVFAGFEPMHPDDDLPGFSYGIKYIQEDGSTRVHVFNSSGDGCLASDFANDRRKRSLNVVTAIAEDILHQVHHDPEDASKVDISIRTDMGIEGFYCPDGWSVKNGPGSTPQTYRARSVIPPKYFENLIYKNMLKPIMSNGQATVCIYSEEIKSVEYREAFDVHREFGVKFYDGDGIRDTLVLEEAGGESPELFVRKMNKVITLMDQFYYELFEMHPSIKMQIEVDFDKNGLICPANFQFVDPEVEEDESNNGAVAPVM
jgi:hypothetical protein